MSYPFAQAPTVQELIATAEQLGCTLEEYKLSGPRGPVTIKVLTRVPQGNGRLLFTEGLPSDPHERLAPDTLRRLCAQLELPTKLFGYDIDWMNDAAD